MKKLLKISLISLLMLIILLSGILFTQAGNTLVKPFLKAELEKQVGLPVEVDLFTLRYDNLALKIVINNALNVDVISIFNLLTQSFDGTYKLGANNFIYDDISIEHANVNGEFKGVPDDLFVNGQGSSFEAPVKYNLRIKDGDAQEITFYMRDMAVADILTLTKQPALAQGKIDANLTIPTLVGNQRNADLKMAFTDITFNDALMKDIYKVSLPKAMKVQGIVDANLTGNQVEGTVDMKSNVANMHLQNVNFNTDTRHITSDYIVDIMDLKSLSELLHTKVDGVLLLKGHVEKSETLNVTGHTKSLGGEIKYALIDKSFTATLEAMPMQNMLQTFSFPPFVDANTTGKMNYDLLTKKGHTSLALADFKLASNSVTKTLETVMPMSPTDIVFGGTSLDASIDGDEIVYNLMAKASEASISIGKGKINREKDTHEAKIEFAFNTYAIAGTVGGSIREPRVGFDTKGFLKDQMLENDFADRTEKEIKKFFKRLF
jgi:hypothetical protein